MTPCEKLGYKVGDEFEVAEVDGRYFDGGEIVTLKKDDGSSIPLFSNGIDDWYMSIHKDVKHINNQEQPMTNLIARNNGEPFATEGNAKCARTWKGLTHTHEVIQHGGGWVLREKQSDAEPETTTEPTTEEQPMPQQHLADQLEAALVALEHAQSEVDRLQSEYRAAYPKIHGEVAIKNHVSLEKWVAGDIVVSAISDYGFTAGKTYRLHKDEYGDLGVTDDVGDKQYGLESYANIDLFWHSHP